MDLRRLLKGFRALGSSAPKGRHFDPTPAQGRRPPVSLRALNPEDIPTCQEIYRLNEPGRFPAGFFPEFEKAITDSRCLFIVACAGNEVVALGGISIPRRVTFSAVSLSFGLVHPRWHRKGVGSALLLGRLCLLPAPDPYWKLTLSPVQDAWSYFTRFGFSFCGRMKVAGHDFNVYDALLYRQQWLECRNILNAAGVTGLQALVDERTAADIRIEAARLRDT